MLRLDCRSGSVSGAWQASVPIAHLAAVGGGQQQVLTICSSVRKHYHCWASWASHQHTCLHAACGAFHLGCKHTADFAKVLKRVKSGSSTQALLAVTAGRAHETLPIPGAVDGQLSEAPQPLLTPPKQPRPNALEAAFGGMVVGAAPSAQPSAAAASGAAQAPALQPDHAAIAVAVGKRLFDAPSHLLRPAPELARDFLRGLLQQAAAQ